MGKCGESNRNSSICSKTNKLVPGPAKDFFLDWLPLMATDLTKWAAVFADGFAGLVLTSAFSLLVYSRNARLVNHFCFLVAFNALPKFLIEQLTLFHPSI